MKTKLIIAAALGAAFQPTYSQQQQSGFSDLQAADVNIAAAVALAVTFIQGVPAATQAAVDLAKAGDDAGAAAAAADITAAANALTAALPTPADPGTTPEQVARAKAAVAKVKG